MAIGHPIIAFDSLESTNKTAADLLSMSKVQHGAVILAREQTAGRGQRGRSWVSSPGLDLCASFVVRPKATRAEHQFALSKIAALAVADVAAQHIAADVRIKWPNDVLVGRRKLAGILITTEVLGDMLQNGIIGVGINVNSTGFPEELLATSFLVETGRELDLKVVLHSLSAAMERWWNTARDEPDDLAQAYLDRLWARGRWVDLLLDAVPVKGRPLDVDDHGRLMVELESGHVQAYGLDRLRFAPR